VARSAEAGGIAGAPVAGIVNGASLYWFDVLCNSLRGVIIPTQVLNETRGGGGCEP
jgi:hypothetical protein